jgi:hypothetical protein
MPQQRFACVRREKGSALKTSFRRKSYWYMHQISCSKECCSRYDSNLYSLAADLTLCHPLTGTLSYFLKHAYMLKEGGLPSGRKPGPPCRPRQAPRAKTPSGPKTKKPLRRHSAGGLVCPDSGVTWPYLPHPTASTANTPVGHWWAMAATAGRGGGLAPPRSKISGPWGLQARLAPELRRLGTGGGWGGGGRS